MTKEDGLQAYKLLGVHLPYVERPPEIPDRFWKGMNISELFQLKIEKISKLVNCCVTSNMSLDKSEEAILNICQGLNLLKCIKWLDSDQFSVKKAGSES